jgi:hypothetical protein
MIEQLERLSVGGSVRIVRIDCVKSGASEHRDFLFRAQVDMAHGQGMMTVNDHGSTPEEACHELLRQLGRLGYPERQVVEGAAEDRPEQSKGDEKEKPYNTAWGE